MQRNQLWLCLILCVCLLPLVGCGKKGPVRPLLKALPAAVPQVEILQVGSAIRLAFELPSKNQDGSPLTDLAAIRIYRRENPGGPCAECDEPNELWREIDPEYPINARRSGNRISLHDSGVVPGYGYRYLIEPVTRSGLSGATVPLAQVCAPTLPPPAALSAVGLDRMVRLAWEPPAQELPPGWSLTGYTIYRTVGDEPFSDSRLNSSLIKTLRYEDIGPLNHTTYRYQLRYLAARGETVVESEASAIVTAIPHPED